MTTIKKVSFIALALSALAPAAGAYDFQKDGIYYNVSQDGKRAIVTYSSLSGNNYSGDIVIPATVDYNTQTLTVRQIDDFAFVNTGITSVTLGENIVIIGNQAFSHCDELKTVTLNQKLYSIGDYAFEYCTSLKTLDIPASTEEIGDAVFQLASSLTGITVALDNPVYTSVDGILYSADMKTLICFPASSEVTNLVVPDGVVTIDESAFMPTINLESIALGANVEMVEPMTFSSSYALKNFSVAEENPDMKSVDGVLFDSGVTTLLQYPLGRYVDQYTLPEGVKTLELLSMAGAHISDLTLPSTLSRINEYAFYQTSDVKSLTVLAVKPPTVLGDKFFVSGVLDNTPLFVAPESVDAYKKAAGWKQFKNIRAIGSDGISGITVDNDAQIEIFDLQGRKVFNGHRADMKVPARGCYIIKADGRSAKVIM